MLSKLHLKTRIMIMICSLVVIAFCTTLSFIFIKINTMTEQEAFNRVKDTAYRYCAEVKDKMDNALEASRTVTAAFTAVKKSNAPDRKTLDNILINVLNDTPQWMGAWACLEPNVLDGRDSEYINAPGHNDQGRYLPWWNRISGPIQVAACTTPNEKILWYQKPMTTGKEYITDPYVTSQKILAVDVCVPITVDGKRIGVTGIDFSMAYFEKLIGDIKLFETGYAFLLSSNGTVVSHPDKTIVGKTMDQVDPQNKDMDAIGQGREVSRFMTMADTKEKAFVMVVPIELGRSGQYWALGVTVPMNMVLKNAHNIRNMSVLIFLVSLVVILVTVHFIARGIAGPITRIASVLNLGANQIASASGEVTDAGQSLAQGTSQQAAAIEETASSLEEMSSMTRQNAGNAKQANAMMQENSTIIHRAHDAMNTLTQAMAEISQASEETSKIIKTIDEIAFQTNLLALNAAVEAARAGEAGAGFAVVADEVRNLALRAAQAAKSTENLIQDTTRKVDDGATLVKTAGEAFSQVNASTEKVEHLIAEIAAASQEQAQGIGQVSQGVAEIDKVVQNNAATAEETASASEEMTGQVHQMKTMVMELMALANGTAHTRPTAAMTLSRASEKNRAYQALSTPSRKPHATIAHSPRKEHGPVPPRAKEIPSTLTGEGDFEDF